MPITREQVNRLNRGDEVHFKECTRKVGLRGGVIEHSTRCKVTSIKLWKTRPDDFEVRVQHGLYEHGCIRPDNAQFFHTSTDCPLNPTNCQR